MADGDGDLEGLVGGLTIDHRVVDAAELTVEIDQYLAVAIKLFYRYLQ